MAVSSRAVYGREFVVVTPIWLWVLQRASGLALGPLVALHIWAPDLAHNRILNALLLAVVLGHGFSGLRRLGSRKGGATGYRLAAIFWSLIVLLFGGMVVLA